MSGSVSRQSAPANKTSAPIHCTVANQIASVTWTTDSRSEVAVCSTFEPIRPAKSFWKKPRLWRST